MKRILTSLLLGASAIAMFVLLCAILPSISVFEPIGRALDEVSVTDIYYASERDAEALPNDKFLIINTAGSDRCQIAEAVEHAAGGDASVIGVDIIFSARDVDTLATERLREALAYNADRIVAAVHLNVWDDAKACYVSDVETSIDDIDVAVGYSNLIDNSDNSYIRNYSVGASDKTPSFAQAVAEAYISQYGDEPEFKSISDGIIDFTPQQFETVDASDLVAIDSLAFGRIVLLGSMSADEDTHFTPVGRMSGVMIQAYSIETLMSNPTKPAPLWLEWLLTVVLVLMSAYGFVVLRDSFEARASSAGRTIYAALGLSNLIYPTFTIIVTVFIVGQVYVSTSCYIRPLMVLGSLAFIPVAYDIRVLFDGLRKRHVAKTVTAAVVIAVFSSNGVVAQEATKATQADYEALNRDIKKLMDNKLFKESDARTRAANSDMLYNVLWTGIFKTLPMTDTMEVVVCEYLSESNPEFLRNVAIDLMDSGFYAAGAEMLKKHLDNVGASSPSYIEDWYKLAQAYYFGDGVDIDYEKSRKCLESMISIIKKDNSSNSNSYYDDAVFLLACCLRAKGFPVATSLYPAKTMDKFNAVNNFTSHYIKARNYKLILEDPDKILGNTKVFTPKIAVTADNYMRFAPLILRSGKSRAFLSRLEKIQDWKEQFGLGLISCYGYDYEFRTPQMEVIVSPNKPENYDVKSRFSVALNYFRKAKSLMENAKFSSSEERKQLTEFVDMYIDLCKAGYEYGQWLTVITTPIAAMSKIIGSEYKSVIPVIRWFTSDHNRLLNDSAQLGDPLAQILMGYMYHIGGFTPYYRDDSKAYQYLSQATENFFVRGKNTLKNKDRIPGDFSVYDPFRYAVANRLDKNDRRIYDFAQKELQRVPKPLANAEFKKAVAERYVDLKREWLMLEFIKSQTQQQTLTDVVVVPNSTKQTTAAKPAAKANSNATTPKSSTNTKSKTPSTTKANVDKAKESFASGTVVDINGEPVIGATVWNLSNRQAVATDIDGKYKIIGNAGDKLKVSFIGMEPKETTVASYSTIVVLTPIKEEKSKTTEKTLAAEKPAMAKTATSTSATKPKTVNFRFRTPNNTKFAETDFKLAFTTNSTRATYHISGQAESHEIPAKALSAGVLDVKLPQRDCDLTLADESGRMHVLHFIYDQALSLRKSATLHLLSIGVNNYPAQNLNNLRYAEDDAADVVDAIVKRHQYTFANINKTVLVGNNVTRDRIESEIEKIADNAGINDLAIIFFAGHGLMDARNYYLATSEVTDATVPRKGGLSASSFAEKIGYINCKLVVFIDACYSAKILEAFRSGGANNGEFFKELTSTPNGTNIYTSSGADVRSREDSKLGHGIFTQALIESCDFDKSDADGDGRITITEIRNYLERRIPQLSGNQQRPVYRNLEEIDYTLFIK